jgi:hypothetical protein
VCVCVCVCVRVRVYVCEQLSAMESFCNVWSSGHHIVVGVRKGVGYTTSFHCCD